MIENLTNGIAAIPPLTLAIFGIIVIVVLYTLPRTFRGLGLKKLGPLEIEQNNQVINHATLKQIEAIDIENRETLWDMTEDVFLQVAMSSKVPCTAAVGHIIDSIASPIRTMVLLNHVAPKLGRSNESMLKSKISHGITRALRDAKLYKSIDNCPAHEAVGALDPNKYEAVIDAWIQSAREITTKACARKIKVYKRTLETVTDKHWVNIYNDCIERNKQYITDMGYVINSNCDVYKQ